MALDFIYTDSNYMELGYLKATVDIEIGQYGIASNDFQVTLSTVNRDVSFDNGSLFYCPDSEWGGMLDNKSVDTSTNQISFMGKTWRGLLEKEYIQPPNGQAYLIMQKEANTAIEELISGRFGDLYVVDNIGLSDIQVNYQIRDYNLLQALEKMLYRADIPSRLDIRFYDGQVHLQAIPIVDLSELLQYDNSYGLAMTAQTASKTYNHILALGKGELTERIRVNLYLKKDGSWSTNVKDSYYKGFERITYKYDNTSEEETTELINGAIEAVTEANGTDTLSISFTSDDADLFDIVGAKEEITGISFKEQITQKILKGTLNGDMSSLSVEYKVGE